VRRPVSSTLIPQKIEDICRFLKKNLHRPSLTTVPFRTLSFLTSARFIFTRISQFSGHRFSLTSAPPNSSGKGWTGSAKHYRKQDGYRQPQFMTGIFLERLEPMLNFMFYFIFTHFRLRIGHWQMNCICSCLASSQRCEMVNSLLRGPAPKSPEEFS